MRINFGAHEYAANGLRRDLIKIQIFSEKCEPYTELKTKCYELSLPAIAIMKDIKQKSIP